MAHLPISYCPDATVYILYTSINHVEMLLPEWHTCLHCNVEMPLSEWHTCLYHNVVMPLAEWHACLYYNVEMQTGFPPRCVGDLPSTRAVTATSASELLPLDAGTVTTAFVTAVLLVLPEPGESLTALRLARERW